MIEGELLAFASSRQGEARRWTELSVYRTDSGRWVLAGNGRSIIPGEVDRPWTKVFEDPAPLIEALYIYDNDGPRYLTRAARSVVEQASGNPEFLTAWQTEVID